MKQLTARKKLKRDDFEKYLLKRATQVLQERRRRFQKNGFGNFGSTFHMQSFVLGGLEAFDLIKGETNERDNSTVPTTKSRRVARKT
jgi:hypothetical protein